MRDDQPVLVDRPAVPARSPRGPRRLERVVGGHVGQAGAPRRGRDEQRRGRPAAPRRCRRRPRRAARRVAEPVGVRRHGLALVATSAGATASAGSRATGGSSASGERPAQQHVGVLAVRRAGRAAVDRALAVAGPTPGSSWSTRNQASSSRGLSASRKQASRSFTCAASRKRSPPYLTYGMPRRPSSSSSRSLWCAARTSTACSRSATPSSRWASTCSHTTSALRGPRRRTRTSCGAVAGRARSPPAAGWRSRSGRRAATALATSRIALRGAVVDRQQQGGARRENRVEVEDVPRVGGAEARRSPARRRRPR